jgi:hypothetical protein
MKLTTLNPSWIDHGDRKGIGIAFDCMVGSHQFQGKSVPCTIRNWILFANPLDGGPAWPGDSRSLIVAIFPDGTDGQVAGCGTCRWNRSGDTFESLSMTPSVNANACGHMTLTSGEFH